MKKETSVDKSLSRVGKFAPRCSGFCSAVSADSSVLLDVSVLMPDCNRNLHALHSFWLYGFTVPYCMVTHHSF